MVSSRRGFLRKSSLLIPVSMGGALAGCVDESEQMENQDEGSDDGEIGSLSIPNPVVTNSRSPNVDVKSVFRESLEDDNEGKEVFFADMENSGSAGSVIVELYWVPEQESGSGFGNPQGELTFYQGEEIQVEANEEFSVSIEGEMPSEYEGFWFVVSSVSVSVEVTNNGGEGEVNVELEDDGEVVDSTVVTIERDETITVDLRGEIEQGSGEDGFTVVASVVD